MDGGSIHVATSLIVHENYSSDPIDNDIAIVVVQEPFVFSEHVQPAVLALTPPEPDEIAVVSGWGIQRV